MSRGSALLGKCSLNNLSCHTCMVRMSATNYQDIMYHENKGGGESWEGGERGSWRGREGRELRREGREGAG